MRGLLADSSFQKRDVMRAEHLETPPWQLIPPTVDISLAETKKGESAPDVFKATALERIYSYEEHVTCYTDGSKTADGVGCAFVCGSTVRSFTLPEHASVFTSELMAIIKLLCFIEVGSEIYHLILSDSLSCLLAIGSFYPSHPLAREIVQ